MLLKASFGKLEKLFRYLNDYGNYYVTKSPCKIYTGDWKVILKSTTAGIPLKLKKNCWYFFSWAMVSHLGSLEVEYSHLWCRKQTLLPWLDINMMSLQYPAPLWNIWKSYYHISKLKPTQVTSQGKAMDYHHIPMAEEMMNRVVNISNL